MGRSSTPLTRLNTVAHAAASHETQQPANSRADLGRHRSPLRRSRRRGQDVGNCLRVADPLRGFGGEVRASGFRDAIIACPLVVLGDAPFGDYEAAFFE